MTLNAQQIGLARKLWRAGKNTHEIAAELHLPEFLIYNGRHYFTERAPTSLAGWDALYRANHAHDGESSPVSVASTLRQEPENCLSSQSTEKIREGAK